MNYQMPPDRRERDNAAAIRRDKLHSISEPHRTPPRILAVWTRALDGSERFGRVNVALQVRSALGHIGTLTNRRLTNVIEEKWPARFALASAAALLAGLLRGRPLPLQCALFATANRRSDLLTEAAHTDVLYLDGIRTLLLMRSLRRAAPGLRIIVDLDDLMSRRYDTLTRNALPLSLGYIENLLPRAVLRVLADGKVARLVQRYERFALKHAEREVLLLADTVVLLNTLEARMLQEAVSTTTPEARAGVVAIPPPAEVQDPRQDAPAAIQWRAIFVGSDTLVQNRMTIAYLLELWSTFKIGTHLHIYGRQKGKWPVVPNVTFTGYVADIADAYTPGSIMVYPCLVPGGIKTKVLEAFAYRVPVVGNSATFEGILPANYPLVVDDRADLATLLNNPASRAQDLALATVVASTYLEQEHTASLFAQRWRRVILGGAGT